MADLALDNPAHFASLANAIPSIDPRTGAHLHRAACLAHAVIDLVGLSQADPLAERILLAARLQTLGKLAIPDEILDKPGPLSAEDWNTLRHHPRFAFELLRQVPSLEPAAAVVLGRYERWDGSGHPSGLARDAIPWASRVLAIAGSIDAMASSRPYRAALSPSEVLLELQRGRATQFDPGLVDQVLADPSQIEAILTDGCVHARGVSKLNLVPPTRLKDHDSTPWSVTG